MWSLVSTLPDISSWWRACTKYYHSCWRWCHRTLSAGKQWHNMLLLLINNHLLKIENKDEGSANQIGESNWSVRACCAVGISGPSATTLGMSFCVLHNSFSVPSNTPLHVLFSFKFSTDNNNAWKTAGISFPAMLLHAFCCGCRDKSSKNGCIPFGWNHGEHWWGMRLTADALNSGCHSHVCYQTCLTCHISIFPVQRMCTWKRKMFFISLPRWY